MMHKSSMHNHTRPELPELVLKPGQFEMIRDLLARYSGVYLDQTRQRVLLTGLAQRLVATGQTLDAYAAYIADPEGRAELQQLAESTLNHETLFFRNVPHMRALQEVILPDLHRRKPANLPLRIWSAGCSTGEEPYSLAMIALETLGMPLVRPVEIWATDLSEQALARARSGRYRDRALTNVTPAMRQRYFQKHGDTWLINEPVRTLVQFAQLNLLEPFPARCNGMDIIFCQNVTIYFQLATCRTLIERFYRAMDTGGILFLGFSETLWNIHDGFRLREVAGSFVYYKPELPQPDSPGTPEAVSAHPSSMGIPRNTKQLEAPARKTGRTKTTPPITLPDARQNVDLSAQRLLGQASLSDTEIIQRGQALLDAGQSHEALELLALAPLNGTHAPQVVALMARAHADRGDIDLAVAEARRAIELDSLTTEAYRLLGMLYAQQGQLPTAVQHFERARYLEPGSAIISFHLAEAYRQLQLLGPALREYRSTLRKLEPYPPDILLDGVAVDWLRQTCKRYVKILTIDDR